MSQIIIDVGAAPNDGTGDPLRDAFIAINNNFSQIFESGPVDSTVKIANNTITTTVINGNLVLAPSGIGRVQVNNTIFPRIDNVYDLGTPTQRFNSLWLGSGGFNTTGNITGQYFVGNGIASGNSKVYFTGANGSIGFSVANSANVIMVNSTSVRMTVPLTVTGNITTPNIIGNVVGNITGNIAAPGSDQEIIYNSNNLLAADPALKFDAANTALSLLGTMSSSGNVTTAGAFVGNVPASARQLYVATNGSDSNNGGLNTPFLTINAALAAATAGTSVHVAPGTYTINNPVTIPANVSLIGDNLRSVTIQPQTPANDMFYVSNGCYVWGITIVNYTGNGFSYNPATPTQSVYVSPYIQNLTSYTTTGTAVKIDGSLTSAGSTKAMIVGFFTIINRGGLGIHIINSGYSQLVNIYTIACDVGVKVESGGFCTLNGSDCSIGNYGLWAEGLGPLQTSGNTVGYSTQGLFRINNQTNGRPHVNTIMLIPGDTTYYTIGEILPVDANTTDIVVQQPYIGNLAPSTHVEFYIRSSIIASAHTFEYVGAGTNPATALPQYGGIPIEANQVRQIDGGVVTYTSTDQKGNFKVGDGFTINQATGEITGSYFYKSLFAQMTPYILALQS